MELVLKRKKQYTDRLRKYHIVLNDNIIGQLISGSSVNINVDTGDRLRFALDWCSSQEFTIENIEENYELEILNPIPDVYIFSSFIINAICFFIGFAFMNSWIMIAPALLLLPLFYKVSLGRKSYLRIRQIRVNNAIDKVGYEVQR